MSDGTVKIGRVHGVNSHDGITLKLDSGESLAVKNTFELPLANDGILASAVYVRGDWHLASAECPK